MNFSEISLAGKRVSDVSYVLSGSTTMFGLPSGVMDGPAIFKIINDYGSPEAEHKASLQAGEKILSGIYDDGDGLYRGTTSTVGIADNHRAFRCYTRQLQP